MGINHPTILQKGIWQFCGFGALLIFSTIQMMMIVVHPAWWLLVFFAIFALGRAKWIQYKYQRSRNASTHHLLHRHYLQSWLYTLLIIFLGGIFVKSPIQWDITPQQSLTLSASSIDLLSQLDKEVQIRAYFPPKSSEQLAFQNLLEQALKHHAKIELQWLSKTHHPLQASKDHIEHEYTVIFEYAAQSYRMEMDFSERGLNQMLRQITLQRLPLLCFDTAFQELDFDMIDSLGTGQMMEILKEHHYDVQPINLEQDIEIDECNVLVLAGPQRPLGQSVLDRIDEFLHQGGHVILLLDPRTQPNISDWSVQYGIELPNNLLLESDEHWQIQGTDPSFMQISSAPHRNNIVLLQGIRSIATQENAHSFNLDILQSHSSSWTVSYPISVLPQPDPQTIGVHSIMVLNIDESNRGALIIGGTSSLIWNQFVEQNPANAHFFKQLMDHFIYEADLESEVLSETSGIFITPIQSVFMWIFTLFITPGILLIFAWWTWRQQKIHA